jgi:hypothetical protein
MLANVSRRQPCRLEQVCRQASEPGIIMVHHFRSSRVVPIPSTIVAVLRSPIELLLSDVGAVATQSCVVVQRLPGQGIVVVANSEEAAEA